MPCSSSEPRALPTDCEHNEPTKNVAKQDFSVTVLVPAAGRGERLGGEPKQYRLLAGESLLLRTLRIFDEHSRVDAVVVAAPKQDAKELDGTLRSAGLLKLHAVVSGGASRQDSVGAALDAAPAGTDVVLVHDAVRPFLAADRIDAVLDAVASDGAAALALPVVDTLRRGNDGDFGATVPREGLFRMQTPQGFRIDWFSEAHTAARRDGYRETDDVALVQRLGHAVKIVAGSALNFKVTTPADWTLARALWNQQAVEG